MKTLKDLFTVLTKKQFIMNFTSIKYDTRISQHLKAGTFSDAEKQQIKDGWNEFKAQGDQVMNSL